MPEGGISREQELSLSIGEAVAVDPNHLGRRYNHPGEAFDLADLYAPSPMVGADRFTRIYFRTESGNIYSLNDKGELLNANKSQQEGKISWTPMNKETVLKQRRLMVGQPFRYAPGSNTTTVTEIVAATDREYSPTTLKEITGGRITAIRSDMVKRLRPLLPQQPQNSR